MVFKVTEQLCGRNRLSQIHELSAPKIPAFRITSTNYASFQASNPSALVWLMVTKSSGAASCSRNRFITCTMMEKSSALHHWVRSDCRRAGEYSEKRWSE